MSEKKDHDQTIEAIPTVSYKTGLILSVPIAGIFISTLVIIYLLKWFDQNSPIIFWGFTLLLMANAIVANRLHDLCRQGKYWLDKMIWLFILAGFLCPFVVFGLLKLLNVSK